MRRHGLQGNFEERRFAEGNNLSKEAAAGKGLATWEGIVSCVITVSVLLSPFSPVHIRFFKVPCCRVHVYASVQLELGFQFPRRTSGGQLAIEEFHEIYRIFRCIR